MSSSIEIRSNWIISYQNGSKILTITENGDSKTQQRDRIGKMLEDLLKN